MNFGLESVLSLVKVNNLYIKLGIPDFFLCRVPEKEEYISNLRFYEITMSKVDLEAKLSFPLYKLSIWFIRTFWIMPAQLK